jgi:uncharacterized protein DUF4412
MNPRRTVLWALLFVFLPALLSAGTVFTVKEQAARGSSLNKLYLQGGRLRVESTTGTGQTHVVLYDAGSGSFKVLDPAKKTWVELPPGGAEQQAAITKMVMERKDLSETKKKQILDNMKMNAERHGMYGGKPPNPPQYKKAASGVKVNGFTADQYEVTRDGQKVREVWLADPKSLGLDLADFAAFKKLGERLGASSTGPGNTASYAWEPGAPEGVPVRGILYENGQPSITADLTAVSHEAVAPALFEVPKDYARTNLGSGPHP